MLNKSKHTIRILEAIEDKWLHLDDGLISITDNKISNTVNPFATMNTQKMKSLMASLMPNNGMKSIYYQNTKNNIIQTTKIEIIEFNNYEKNEFFYEYKGLLTLEKFKYLLINNEPVVFDKQEESIIQQYFEKIKLNNSAIFNIEFISSKGLMKLVKKTIKKKKDDILIPYFNEKTPSVIENSEDIVIDGHNHFVFENNNNKYLKIKHYSNLGLKVYTTINPDEKKVIPAVIVEDMNGTPLEVHCYYKNEYISKDLLNELKPNILKEDFRSNDYFTVRDIEFLDMILI